MIEMNDDSARSDGSIEGWATGVTPKELMMETTIHFRRGVKMPDSKTSFQLIELVPFIGALTTGAIGGCVASIQQARTRRETMAAYAIAYMITGGFGGLMALAGSFVFYPGLSDSWPKLFLITGLAGVGTALALAAGNLSMRIILKKLGMEVTVDVKRVSKESATIGPTD